MKSIITLSILCIFTFTANISLAQKKCKYDYEREDPFTGKSVKGIKTTIFRTLDQYWNIIMEKDGDDYKINVVIKILGEYNINLEKNDSIMFKLDNNTIITLYAAQKSTPFSEAHKSASYQPIFTTRYEAKYTIEQFDQFKESPVTYVRMNISDQLFETKLSNKAAKNIMNGASCLMH